MNKDTVAGDWKILKGKIKKAWGEINDDEIEAMQGELKQFEGQLQKTYGLVKKSRQKKSALFSALLL